MSRIASAIIFPVLLGVCLAACDRSKDMYGKVIEKHVAVIKDAAVAREEDFVGTVRDLKEFVAKYPNFPLAANIDFSIAQMHMNRNEHAKGLLEKNA